MTSLRCILLLLLVVGAPGALLHGAAPVSGQKLEQTRARIDALLRHRLQPSAPPDARTNPFRLGEAAPSPETRIPAADGTAPAADSSAPEGDAALLKRAAETLIVGGRGETGGRLFISINKVTYQEGDSLTVRLPNTPPVVLRVRQITTTQVTLTLNEAEVNLKIQPGSGR